MQAPRQGTADFGITVPPIGTGDEFAIRALRRFSLAALASREFEGHFAQRDDWVTLDELHQGELVLFTDEMEYNSFLMNCPSRPGASCPSRRCA